MKAWKQKTFRLDPWSLVNLERMVLKLQLKNEKQGTRYRKNGKGPQPVNASVALRYVLRRLRFDDLPAPPKPKPRESVAQRVLREGRRPN